MLPVVYGIDPDETWEIDYVAATTRRTIDSLRAHAKALRERAAGTDASLAPDAKTVEEGAALAAAVRVDLEARAADAEAKASAAEADLAGYVPGSGPVFVVGSIPNGKRAEILGESIETQRMEHGTEALVRDRKWSETVVRWGVRDHRNLLSGKSKQPIPFRPETIAWDGEERKVPGRKTLEAYAPILGDLALLVLDSQRMDEAGKNG